MGFIIELWGHARNTRKQWCEIPTNYILVRSQPQKPLSASEHFSGLTRTAITSASYKKNCAKAINV